MTDPGSTTATFGDVERIDVSQLMEMNLKEARLRQANDPEGKHIWVVAIMYSVDDPEASLDEFVANSENFVGALSPTCLLCGVEYTKHSRDERCQPEVSQT